MEGKRCRSTCIFEKVSKLRWILADIVEAFRCLSLSLSLSLSVSLFLSLTHIGLHAHREWSWTASIIDIGSNSLFRTSVALSVYVRPTEFCLFSGSMDLLESWTESKSPKSGALTCMYTTNLSTPWRKTYCWHTTISSFHIFAEMVAFPPLYIIFT